MFHIIDDEIILCELAVELLTSAGHQAEAFSNPLDYIDYLHSENYVSPIAIFTDVRMPEMSGLTLIDKIHAKYPQQKIVVTSGYDEGQDAYEKKICHFLSKPYHPEKFIAIASSIVRCVDEQGSVVNATCKSLPAKTHMDAWQCPLQCTRCDGRTPTPE